MGRGILRMLCPLRQVQDLEVSLQKPSSSCHFWR